MRFNVGYSVVSTEHRIYIQQIPNVIAWLNGVYDFVDELLGHRICNTRLHSWLYRWEDEKSTRFFISADSEESKRFYEFMNWEQEDE